MPDFIRPSTASMLPWRSSNATKTNVTIITDAGEERCAPSWTRAAQSVMAEIYDRIAALCDGFTGAPVQGKVGGVDVRVTHCHRDSEVKYKAWANAPIATTAR
jgi:hypothetical protein